MENSSDAYYAYRKFFNALLARGPRAHAEAASLFYYLNRTGFNGLCRFNSRGEFNVPFGSYARIAYVRDFARTAPCSRVWEFSERRLRSVAAEACRLRLRDPPYDVPFTQYARGRFSWDDQVRARRVARAPSGSGGALEPGTRASSRSTSGWDMTVRFLGARAGFSCTGDRTPAREVLATRNV